MLLELNSPVARGMPLNPTGVPLLALSIAIGSFVFIREICIKIQMYFKKILQLLNHTPLQTQGCH